MRRGSVERVKRRDGEEKKRLAVSSPSGTADDRHDHTSPSLIADKLSSRHPCGWLSLILSIGLSEREVGLGVARVMSAPTTADARGTCGRWGCRGSEIGAGSGSRSESQFQGLGFVWDFEETSMKKQGIYFFDCFIGKI